jgi:hypothetical protein
MAFKLDREINTVSNKYLQHLSFLRKQESILKNLDSGSSPE